MMTAYLVLKAEGVPAGDGVVLATKGAVGEERRRVESSRGDGDRSQQKCRSEEHSRSHWRDRSVGCRSCEWIRGRRRWMRCPEGIGARRQKRAMAVICSLQRRRRLVVL
uniref:Uncharacterized protein n=1 Tax=Steinernema glaseri TaxID=37863 RepID=A0A1I7ZZL1_9BILA